LLLEISFSEHAIQLKAVVQLKATADSTVLRFTISSVRFLEL